MKVELYNALYQKALPVLNKIISHGHEAYFVGGCVRDTLLGLPIHDIDIASSATPDEIQNIFKITIDVGKEHGTIIVLHEGIPYEVTTFRTEGEYTDYRRPNEVSFVRNLREDTLRRDFTINALAISPLGELKDYHQGVPDLQAKVIRSVGIPTERFQEDALRMMRAIRFASQLGFTIEESTLQAIQELSPLLTKISVERIRIELSKFLQGPYFEQCATMLCTSQLYQYLPAFETSNLNEWHNRMAEVSQALSPLIHHNIERDERLCWALLSRTVSSDSVRSFMKKWTHSNQMIQDVEDLLTIMVGYDLQQIDDWFVYQHRSELLALVATWKKACENEYQPEVLAMKARLPIANRKELNINGKQLMVALNMKQGGAIIGELLEQLEYEVVTKVIKNDLEVLVQRAVVLANINVD